MMTVSKYMLKLGLLLRTYNASILSYVFFDVSLYKWIKYFRNKEKNVQWSYFTSLLLL